MSERLPAVPDPGAQIAAEDVARWERQITEVIRTVDDVKLLNEWRARAAALETYLRGKELQRPMMGAQRRVEARIGELLGPGGQGVRTDLTSPHEGKSIDRHDREDFRVLARAFAGCPLTQDEWRKSRRALVSLIRQRAGLIPDTPPLPDGIYRCIVADPPWKLDTGPDVFGGTGEAGHDALAYEQMSLEEIRALPVEQHAADDAHLYLWTTNRYVEAAYDIARAWGFKPSVLLVWAKAPRGIGLGDAFRLTTEFILYARRGSLDESCIVETSWFDWPRGRHSEKPDSFYALAETVACECRHVWYTRNQKGRSQAASAETIDRDKIRRTCLLPDVVIWSIPGEHHEIKHKNPHHQRGYADSYGLEIYRFNALVEFAEECRQPVLLTHHDWERAGAADVYERTPNRLADWLTIPVLDLTATRRRREAKFPSYCNGKFVADVPGYYWPSSLWMPLERYWTMHQPTLMPW